MSTCTLISPHFKGTTTGFNSHVLCCTLKQASCTRGTVTSVQNGYTEVTAYLPELNLTIIPVNFSLLTTCQMKLYLKENHRGISRDIRPRVWEYNNFPLMFDIPRDRSYTQQASCYSLSPLTRRHCDINLLYHPYSVYSANILPSPSGNIFVLSGAHKRKERSAAIYPNVNSATRCYQQSKESDVGSLAHAQQSSQSR